MPNTLAFADLDDYCSTPLLTAKREWDDDLSADLRSESIAFEPSKIASRERIEIGTKVVEIGREVVTGRTTATMDDRFFEDKFRQLASEWERETSNISSVTDMTSHPKYREIIDLGWRVVPLMLNDLKNGHGFWFTALTEITKIRPFDRRDAGNSKRMVDAWLHWGKMNKIQF
jgi:hypothetical protein